MINQCYIAFLISGLYLKSLFTSSNGFDMANRFDLYIFFLSSSSTFLDTGLGVDEFTLFLSVYSVKGTNLEGATLNSPSESLES
jgi:hypothetical protein